MEAQASIQKQKPKRDRNVQMVVRMAPEEKAIIKKRMAKAGLSNFNLYALLMLMAGEIKVVDLTRYHELAKEVSRVGTNINQIAAFVNAHGRIYESEIAELKERMDDIWRLLKSSLSEAR